MACISTIRSDLRSVFDFEVVLFEVVTIISAGCTDENSITSASRSDTVQILLSVHPHHWPQQMRKYQIHHQQICFSSSKCTETRFRPGLCHGPCWVSLRCSPRPLVGWRGAWEVSSRYRGRREGRYPLPIPFPLSPMAPCFSGPSTQITGYARGHTDQNFNTKSSTNPIQKHVNTSITAI